MSGGAPFSRLASCSKYGMLAWNAVTDVLKEKMLEEVNMALQRLNQQDRELSGCISVKSNTDIRAMSGAQPLFYKLDVYVELYPPFLAERWPCPLIVEFRKIYAQKWIIWKVDLDNEHIPREWLKNARLVVTIERDGEVHTHNGSLEPSCQTRWVHQFIDVKNLYYRQGAEGFYYDETDPSSCLALKTGDKINISFEWLPTGEMFSPCHDNDAANQHFPLTVRIYPDIVH